VSCLGANVQNTTTFLSKAFWRCTEWKTRRQTCLQRYRFAFGKNSPAPMCRLQSQVQGHRHVKKCGVDTNGERGARAYDGGLEAEPSAGSRGRAPGQVVTGAKPPKAEILSAFGCPMEAANLPHSPYFANCLTLWYL